MQKLMAVHYRTKGFFIKKTDRGEDSESFTVYTKDFGKLKILGKAIRKIKSKLRGGAGLFYLSEIEFIQGKHNKTLTDAILIEKLPNIRKDLKKLSIARQIAELLDDLISGEGKDENIWALLQETLERLNNWRITNYKLSIVYYYFFWNLVSLLGYQPELQDYSIDGEKTNGDIIKILKVILKKDWSILSRLKIEPIHQKLLKEVSECYNEKIQT